ncbi:MAG: NifB/NifX family molybdenum-iron cluster-binding protein [Bacteroidales bacterium]
MKKRIAIPLENGLLCPHFGHCQAFAFIDVDDDKITNVTVFDPPEHQPGTFPGFVATNGATDVIGGGMGPQAVTLFNQAGINVFIGAPVEEPSKLVNDFIAGTLVLSANYCDHGDGDHHEHHH